MMNLKKLKQEEGIKAVAKHVLQEYHSANQLRRGMEKHRLTTKIYQPFFDYVFATAKSPRKIGERLNEIILNDLRARAEDEKGMF